ncbi:MAG: cell envelope integrity protein TolA [Gallionella sp.]|nr:cell envelope integrity protein TolA [Gallionella sp.]
MSHALTYGEPYRLSAGLLALAVHAAFFTLLVLGVRWQSQPTEDFSVQLWGDLPVVEAMPTSQTNLPVESEQAPVAKVEPPQQSKSDIELREKKVQKMEPTPQELKAQRDAEEQRVLEEYAEKRRQSEQARVRAEISAAMAAEVGRYQDMIRSKIRRNIVMPPDVTESAVAEFRVTLLPGGMVMETLLLKSSGNAAYDNAAERAIYKAQPLPLPTDPGMQKMFRELRLTIRP